jgi:hypothetical protein
MKTEEISNQPLVLRRIRFFLPGWDRRHRRHRFSLPRQLGVSPETCAIASPS